MAWHISPVQAAQKILWRAALGSRAIIKIAALKGLLHNERGGASPQQSPLSLWESQVD